MCQCIIHIGFFLFSIFSLLFLLLRLLLLLLLLLAQFFVDFFLRFVYYYYFHFLLWAALWFNNDDPPLLCLVSVTRKKKLYVCMYLIYQERNHLIFSMAQPKNRFAINNIFGFPPLLPPHLESAV